jgi:hypothetical protein
VYSVSSSFNSYSKPSLGVLSIGSGVTGVTLLEPLSEVPVSKVPVSDVPVFSPAVPERVELEVLKSEFIKSEVIFCEEFSAPVSPQAELIPIVKVAKNATAATNIFLFILTSPCPFKI